MISQEQIKSINEVCNYVYEIAKSKGFHEDDESDPTAETSTAYCEIHKYLSGCWEGYRKSDGHDLSIDFIGINQYVYELCVSPTTQPWPRYIVNLHGEVSELYEAYKNGKLLSPCDKADKMQLLHLRPLNCAEEELADIVIRCMDTAKALNVNLGEAIQIKARYNETREYRHGGKKA